ncbi:MAG: hypothetical protein M0P91_08315 [Sulfuricurvum sp.]|uniref:hypothetical protein n=1 Tax=Sulfuricurvum sp. TaxID=2025608 RepID=UPI0025E5BA95|nr:hypothetical protein [Sulfuricurvum sp.]MCK9373188.1 hypothetical protein [Sulfuricurvum sp.]
MIRIRKSAVGSVLFFLISTGLFASEESMIRESVRQYTQGIIIASKKDRVEHMEPFATEKRAQKLMIWMKSWHENNYFMDSSIEKIDFGPIRIDKEKATVTTQERWRWRYIQIVTKEVSQPWTQSDYAMQYNLVKIGPRWKVDDAKILSEKETPLLKVKK